MVRAKFRVLSVTAGWRGSSVVEAAPIMPRTKDWPQEENSEENAAFWNATPSGRLSLTFEGGSPYAPGDALYVDLERAAAEEKGWFLNSLTLWEAQVGVSLYPDPGHYPRGTCSASFEMQVNNRAAWPPFIEAGPGSRWRVTISRA